MLGTVLWMVTAIAIAAAAWSGGRKHRVLKAALARASEVLGLELDGWSAMGMVDGQHVTLTVSNLEEVSPSEELWTQAKKHGWLLPIFLFMGFRNPFMLFIFGGGLVTAMGAAATSTSASLSVRIAPRGSLTARARPSRVTGLITGGLTETQVGDEEFDEHVVMNGPVLEVFSALDAPTRGDLKVLVEASGKLEAGSLSIDLGADVTGERVVEMSRWLAGMAGRLGAENTLEATLQDPDPQVRAHAAEAVLRHGGTRRLDIRDQVLAEWGDRPLVDAVAQGGALAVFALDLLGEVGHGLHIQPMLAHADGPVVERVAEQAAASIRARVKGEAAGRVSVASDEAGGLSLSAAGQLSEARRTKAT